MKYPTLKLLTNLPLHGSLKYVEWFVHPTYGERLSCTIQVPPGDPGYAPMTYKLYLPSWTAERLLELEVATELAPKNGVRQFHVMPAVPLVVSRTEEDGKKITTITRADRIDSGGGPVGTSPPAAGAATRAAPEPGVAGPTAGPDPRRAILKGWLLLGEAYGVASRMAAEGLALALERDRDSLDAAAVQAGAATLLIQAASVGLTSYRGLAEHVLAVGKAKGAVASIPTFKVPDCSRAADFV